MAKFRYKMQSILDVKEKLENKAKQDFAQANARLDAEKVKLVELQKKDSDFVWRKLISARSEKTKWLC